VIRAAVILLTVLLPLLAGRAAEELAEEKVEARVNDKILTTTELERRLAPLYSQYEDTAPASELGSLKRKARQDAINGWVDEQLMLLESENHPELKVDPIEVEREFRATRNRFPSEEFFLKSLRQEGLDEEKFKERLAEGIKMRQLLYLEVVSRVNISPGEIIAYYNEHSSEFKTPEQVRLAIIMIPAPIDPGEKRSKAAQTAALVVERLAAGEEFFALAREYSQGPNVEAGGDMGYFRTDEMLAATASAVEGIEVGGNTGVLETPGGFQILKVTGRKQASYKTLEDVWESIHDRLFTARRRQLQEKWLAGLRAKNYVLVGE